MFGKKKLEKEIDKLNDDLFELRSIVRDLCPHENVTIETTNYWDGHSAYYIVCQKCGAKIDIVGKEKSIQIMKEQELRHAEELIAKSEQEEKENKDA